ncbi:MAG TPA: hypothetical protein PLO06_05115 [Methanoregulaceae archaeon]|nr:hypothetical protein [Methanoregulaceae archaeon]
MTTGRFIGIPLKTRRRLPLRNFRLSSADTNRGNARDHDPRRDMALRTRRSVYYDRQWRARGKKEILSPA